MLKIRPIVYILTYILRYDKEEWRAEYIIQPSNQLDPKFPPIKYGPISN